MGLIELVSPMAWAERSTPLRVKKAERGPARSVRAVKARPGARNRFIVDTARLQRRLKPAVRTNMAAVGRYHYMDGDATAFLVTAPNSKGIARVVTNWHVVEASSDLARVVFFPDGPDEPGMATRVERIVAADSVIDTAIVEIWMPPDLRELKPVRLARRSTGGPHAVYSAGFAALEEWASPDKRDIRWTRGRDYFERARKHFDSKVITLENQQELWDAVVAADDAGRSSGLRSVAWGHRRGDLSAKDGVWQEGVHVFNLPAKPGSSGSPIFDARTHEVIALQFGGADRPEGPGDWANMATPVEAVRQFLEANE